MKVALNPEELRLILDALDDKHQFQRGEGGSDAPLSFKIPTPLQQK